MKNYSTFTDGTITFEYPASFEEQESLTGKDIVSGASHWKDIAFFSFENIIDILISKSLHAKSPTTARDDTETGVLMISNSQILTHSTIKNSNGILAQKSIHSLMEPQTRIQIIFNSIFFRARRAVYGITVTGPELHYELIDIAADIIFETLRKNDFF